MPDANLPLLLTAGVLLLLFIALFRTRIAPDVLFLAAVTTLLCTGVLTPGEAFSGLSNAGVLTVAVLYVVAAAIKETGGVQWIVQTVLGKPRSILHAQLRLMLPVTAFSAALIALVLTVGFGLIGTWRVLGEKPAPVLRNL